MEQQHNYEDEEQLDEAAGGSVGMEEQTSSSDSLEELYGQIAQKDRDLVLAAELGKALLESNQELQRRYDAMYEEYSLKVENLQQEKYNLHLEIEKIETEHQNKLKDLQDDISTLRQQLQCSNQHQHDNDAETSRTLLETKQKADYLAEQVQQGNKQQEELKQELKDEKDNNEKNLCVIQDHLEHINMLREQVEYLSEKLKETTEALLETQAERDRLLAINDKSNERLKSLQGTVELQDEKIKSHESHVKMLQAQLQAKGKKTSHQNSKQPGVKCSSSLHQFTRSKGRNNNSNNNNNSNRPQALDQPHCYSETISNSSHLAPLSLLDMEQGMSVPQLSPPSLFRDNVDGGENLRQSLPVESSLLSEFSTTIRHRRNKSDCSVVSLSEGSRKRHHETIAGESDDEAESSDKSSKGSVCKQTLYSELMDCNNAFVPTSSKYDQSTSPNLPMDLDLPDPEISSVLTPPPDQMFDSSHKISPSPSPSPSITSSSPLTPPEDDDSEDIIDHLVQTSHYSRSDQHAPMNREASLFEELSSKLTDLDRQNSNTSEKSLFDELSSEMKHHQDSNINSCLLGHPDFYSSSHSDGNDGHAARQSEDDNSYTCEWPLLTSVSADMLDGDDFECDDDDFLVGNVAGSTLSIGDSGVGIMMNSFSGKADSSDIITRRSLEYHRGGSWHGTTDVEVADKQDLKEACRLMQDLVDHLQGYGQDMQDLSSPENEVPSYGFTGDASFDSLFSLIKKARQCVDDMEHGEVSHLRRFSARQWQLEDLEPMEEFKIPVIPVIKCSNNIHPRSSSSVGSVSVGMSGLLASQPSNLLPHWTKRKELKRTTSSSSLTLRRSV